MSRRYLVSLVLLPLGLGGCSVAISPPIHTTHYGAPERLREGDLEVHGAATGGAGLAPMFGAAMVGYGVKDWASIELGGAFAHRTYAMGTLGPRFTLSPNRDNPIHAAADFELGLGLGAGGQSYRGTVASENEATPISDERRWHQRLAFGGYTGFGFGLHIHWFAIFGRLKIQGSQADGLPATFWSSGAGGVQFRIKRTVDLYLAGGYFGYVTDYDVLFGGLYEVGLAIHFDVLELSRKHRAKRRAQQAG